MAEGGSRVPDVNELFQRMGEKLGWFQNKQNIPVPPDTLPGSRKKKEIKSRTEGSEKKLIKKKGQSAKTTKVRKKTPVDSEDMHKPSEKRTPAKVPKTLGSAGNSKSKLISSEQKNPAKSSKYKAKHEFNFSSSDDEDFQQFPVKRTLAHTNLPKVLGSADTYENIKNQMPDLDRYDEGKSKKNKTVLKSFDLSSSEDEVEPKGNSFHKTNVNNALSNVKTCETERKACLTKPLQSNRSKAKVSDSFVEKVDFEDTFVSCVGESLVDQDTVRKSIHYSRDDFRVPTLSQNDIFSVDDTIVQKPVRISPESFSPDMDMTFDQPPCESTRIHRRSSVSYKKLLGSPEDLNSSGTSDDNKHYETCRPNVSGDLDNEPEDPLSVTTHEVHGNENIDKKSSDEMPKTIELKVNGNSDNFNDKQNNDLCKELHNLSIHQHNSLDNSQSWKSQKKICKNDALDNDPEFIGTSIEQSFDEIVEVVDVYTQTELSLSEEDLSPLKHSLSESGLSENHRKVLRKTSNSSVQSVTESDVESDVSEVEIKHMSVQTDTCLNISEVNINMNTSVKENDQVNSDAIISHEKIEIKEETSDSDVDKQQDLSENESIIVNSAHRIGADRDKSDSSEVKINEKGNSESEENASNITDVESTGESCSEPDDLSSESEKDSKRKDVKKKPLKLKRKGVQSNETDKKRTSGGESDSVSDDTERCQNHLPDVPSPTEVTAQNTWRRKKVSESSSEEDLEAYFEKLRNPKKSTAVRSSSSEASPVSMEDFIVEDDEISSESDDTAFYIKENRNLEETPPRPKTLKSTNFVDFSDSDDSDFTAYKYPGSVTKHKKRTNKPKTKSKSWSLSDEEDENYPTSKPSQKNIPPEGDENIGKAVSRPDKNNKTEKQGRKTEKEPEVGKGVSETNEEILFKTPKPLTRVTKITSNKENVPNGTFKTPKAKHDTEGVFKTPKSYHDSEGVFKTPKSSQKVKTSEVKESTKTNDRNKTEKVKFITPSESDDDFDDSVDLPDLTPSVLKEVTRNTKVQSKSLTDEDLLRKPSSVLKGSKATFFTPQPVQSKYSFLKSLSTVVQEHRRDPEAARFVNGFKKTKEQLSQHLFRVYNRTVFENQLPSDLPIEWNKRLLRTAGYCTYKKSSKNPEDRSVKIELSTKVCDSAERVRDTLIHELCHAAVWLINGTRDGHGRFWKYWARKANQVHPEIPVIARCHDYSINTKYTYQCTQCGYSIGRHSKSLDTEKKVCGYCHGRFELMQNSGSLSSSGADPTMTPKTPRTPNRFALYVKEHYSTVKKRDKNLKHGDVMKELSKQFAEMNKI